MTPRGLANYLIAAGFLLAGLGPAAHAQGTAGSDPATSPSVAAEPADRDALLLADVIEIFDERPDKPFERDTEIRLTGEQLAARGAVDLATALALLPDVRVRDGGRGGFNIDIRGARKGAVSILIDGVLVSDPYYGTFDVSTIPVTDIVQIRVATTPQSPIDGPGGPGGVIEVHTRDAIGPQVVVARLLGDSLPSVGATGTARLALADHLALRVSASGLAGARDLELPMNASVGEGRRAGTGAARLEYRRGERRLAVDGFLDSRHYVSPPSDVMASSILLIDRETTARLSAKLDDRIGGVQVQARGWGHYLYRRSRYFLDPALTEQQQSEDLAATRVGAMALATRPLGKDLRWAASTTIDHEQARVETQGGTLSRGNVTMIEPALDLQYERRRLRIDGAVGAALPIGVGASPWPEAKLAAKYRAARHLELTATVGRKGRLPSLRERFDAATGNPALGPEQAYHAELRAIEQLDDRVRVEVAPFYRRTTGTTRVSIDTGKLANLGELDLYGVDCQGRVQVLPRLELGGSYNYIKASSEAAGDDPLDRLPRHRFDAWVQGSPLARLSALARVRYSGEALDRMRVTEGYALVEATLTARLSSQYLGVLRVDDVLDLRPETRAGYHAPGRVISVVFQGTWE